MPLSYAGGHDRRAPGLPARCGRVRREPSGHGPSRRIRRPRPTPGGAHQRPAQRIEPGRAQYTHLLDADDASVVDDIIVWWVDDDRFDVMPNASNTERVISALTGPGVTATDVTATRAVLAVQGPGARRRLGEVAPEAAAVGPVPRRALRVARPAVPGGRHRLHRRRRCGVRGPCVGGSLAVGGRDGRGGDAGRSGCTGHTAPRGRACRCTATNWAPGSRRCRPASGGWSAGTRDPSGAERRSRSSAGKVLAAG